MYEEPQHRPPTPSYQVAPDGHSVTISRHTAMQLAVAFVALLVLAAFFLGRITAVRPVLVTTRTVTTTAATPATPHTLHPLLGWRDTPNCFTLQCNMTASFTITGPIMIVTACEPQGEFADSDPTLDFSLVNSGGHIVDTVTKTCGDPNASFVATNLTIESVPSGQYTIQIYPSSSAPATLVVYTLS